MFIQGIEELKERREDVNRAILKEEEEKEKIQNDIRILNERLTRLNESLARKVAARSEYDKTIQDTEASYIKVCPTLINYNFFVDYNIIIFNFPQDTRKFSNTTACFETRINQPCKKEAIKWNKLNVVQ